MAESMIDPLRKLIPLPNRFTPENFGAESEVNDKLKVAEESKHELVVKKERIRKERDGFPQWSSTRTWSTKAQIFLLTIAWLALSAVTWGSAAGFVKENLIVMGDSWFRSLLFTMPLVFVGPVSEHLLRGAVDLDSRSAKSFMLVILMGTTLVYVVSLAVKFAYFEDVDAELFLDDNVPLESLDITAPNTEAIPAMNGEQNSNRDSVFWLFLGQWGCEALMAGILVALLGNALLPQIAGDWKVRDNEIRKINQEISKFDNIITAHRLRQTVLRKEREEFEETRSVLDLCPNGIAHSFSKGGEA